MHKIAQLFDETKRSNDYRFTGMAQKSSQTKTKAGRPKGPPKRGRVVRLPKDLDEALDVFGRLRKMPVSTIIEGLVRIWAAENQAVIAKGRDAFGMPAEGVANVRSGRTKRE